MIYHKSHIPKLLVFLGLFIAIMALILWFTSGIMLFEWIAFFSIPFDLFIKKRFFNQFYGGFK